MKSEPDVFSIWDLMAKGTSGWDGVRNFQARNFLRAMRKGDRAFFYHSNADPPCIVGEVEIVKEAYPDPTQFDPKSHYYDDSSNPKDPRWSQVDVRFVREFPRPLTLQEIKGIKPLREMVLVTRGRLSVQPVASAEWNLIVGICGRR